LLKNADSSLARTGSRSKSCLDRIAFR
jgi:hypothetical protein